MLSRRKKTTRRNVLSVTMASRRPALPLGRMGAILVLALASCAVVGYATHMALQGFMNQAFYQNRDFHIRVIDVKVNGTMPRGQVLEWARVRTGDNLMALDLRQVRAKLLENPYVAEATVERRLPDTLRITVDERQPLALLKPRMKPGYQAVQSVYYVDSKASVMKPKQGELLKRLPEISGVDSDRVQEGVVMTQPEVLSAINFIRLVELSPVGVDLDLSRIDVSSRAYFEVHTRDKGRIRFRTDYLDQQLQRLAAIFDYARAHQKTVKTVDLSPDRNVPVTFF
jgi:cell division septal protein FtsQ